MVSTPSRANILHSTWAFKKKKYLDSLLKTYKARFCVRGDQQIEGANVFEIYMTVVSWITVRILLILSIVLVLEPQQVDYINTFCREPLGQTV